MIKEVNGNLLTYPNIQVLCHQVNALGVMGAGIAKQIKTKWPNVFEEYRSYCKDPDDPHKLLGKCQLVHIESDRYVANLFGEYSFYESIAPYEEGGKPRHTDYDALKEALHRLHTWMVLNDKVTVGIPFRLGAGLAGGNWDIIYKMVVDEFGDDEDITLYIVKYM